jgi:glycosyltransferase involved in cell wall biosynthesis
VTLPDLHVVVPGALDQRTGGYIYDACIIDGLRRMGWRVVVHELDGTFPEADETAYASLTRVLTDLPDNTCVVVDGLAMGGLPGPLRLHRDRLRILGLVHHPLADETGLDEYQRRCLSASERDALSVCRGVVVTSEKTASRLIAYGVPAARVCAVPPGTEPARLADGPGPGLPPQILCVGAVIPRKAQDVLVRALARLRERSWRCICAGSLTRNLTYVDEVQAQVLEVGLTERVRFIGECAPDTLDELYHSSSMFALPSYDEGYGMALSEALARGLPVVSTTGGAIPDTVPVGSGVLVPPGDDGALATILDDLLTDASRCQSLASAARRYAATLPNWDQAAAAFAVAVTALCSRAA